MTGSGSLVLESLGSGLVDQSLEPFLVTLQPEADSGDQVMAHDGHELVYCLEGEIEYRIEDRIHRLGAGESLLFEAWLPHCWCNPGDKPAIFLLVFQAGVQGVSLEQHLHT
jgi:quercetin dioxygenase-like cupin family protein